ncbi:MAG: ribosome biogenesis GTPase YlqF [Rhodoferax sp.]
MALIQWFPGHMHLTRQALADRLKQTDVVLELLDARLPGSSANPMLAQLTRGKPTLKLLNKQDLADPDRTALWLAHYAAQPGTQALAMDATERAPARRLIDACHALSPGRGNLIRPLRVLVCGVPNVGKSTLINTLVGKRATAAADEAGVTRHEQRIVLADGFYLYDTPGVLWPRIIVAQSGLRLAASGAIGRNAFDEPEVALELLGYLRHYAPERLVQRYKLTRVADLSDEALFDAIGRQRGALQSGGRVNVQKAAEAILDDFRSGRLGRLTLETPEEFAQWLAHGERLDAARQLKKDAIVQARQRRRKQVPGDGPRPREDASAKAKPAARAPARRKNPR